MKKQAFLIMYHNDYYILEKLLKQIDNSYFDIYLHVDKKARNFDFEYTKNLLKKSNIYFVKRQNVKWSTFGQIKCELQLLKEASKKDYSYYHLLSGVDLLLRSSDEIYNFYKQQKNKEFIAYKSMDTIDEDELARIKYYHILNCNRRHNKRIVKTLSNKIYYRLLTLQKYLKINRLKRNKLEIRKGANWFDITHDFVKYVLTKEKEINKLFKHSNCADELFLQTLAYNSSFRDNVCMDYLDELKNVKRCIDWKRGQPYTYTIDDYAMLINDGAFFARKFSSTKDKEIIDKIYKYTTRKE